jgi:hypothetical protein
VFRHSSLLGRVAGQNVIDTPSLWLSPSTAVWPPGLPQTGRRLRRVLAADSREPLGHVALSPGRWWPWPAGRTIVAYEAPDSSLVFTARRLGWLRPTTVVTEADGHIVAFAYEDRVASPTYRFLARRDCPGGWRSGAFVASVGVTLFRWEPSGGGTVTHFAEETRNEPFLRMGLLAALLMHGSS